MKKIMTVLVVLLLCVGVGGCVYAVFVLANKSTVAQKRGVSLDGFRDVTWGDALAKHPKLRRERNDPYYVYYSNKDDSLKIGGAELKSIQYMFYDGKAAGMHIDVEGVENFEELKRVLFKQYGEANGGKKILERYTYVWEDHFRSDIWMHLTFSDISKSGEFSMLRTSTMLEAAAKK